MGLISVDGWEPPHLSYSTVSGYRGCGKRTQLSKVLRLEEQPGIASLAGNAVHEATEIIDGVWEGTLAGEYDWSVEECDTRELFITCWDRALKDRQERSPSFTPDQYVATGRAGKEYGGKKTAAWWFDNGPRMVDGWVDWRKDTGWGIATTPSGESGIEFGMNFILPGDIPVKAFIDRIMVLPNGNLTVVDLKTGRLPETGEQLGLYKVGLQLLFGVEVQWGYYWHPDKGHGQPIALGKYTPEYFGKLFADAARGMNAGVFLPQPANNCAAWCGVSRFCAAVGGSEARGNDPLFSS